LLTTSNFSLFIKLYIPELVFPFNMWNLTIGEAFGNRFQLVQSMNFVDSEFKNI